MALDARDLARVKNNIDLYGVFHCRLHNQYDVVVWYSSTETKIYFDNFEVNEEKRLPYILYKEVAKLLDLNLRMWIDIRTRIVTPQEIEELLNYITTQTNCSLI